MSKTCILERLGTFLIAGLAILGLVIVTGCGQGSQPTQASQNLQTVKLGASWSRTYQDLKSLKQGSDVVVAGTITGIADVTRDQQGLAFTDFVFSISRVVGDPQHLIKSSSLILHQTGGVVGHVQYEIDDDPLFQLGEQSVLFLHQYSPGHFYVVGGPTGRFSVQNGMVKPINDEGVKFSTTMSQADFFVKVQSA